MPRLKSYFDPMSIQVVILYYEISYNIFSSATPDMKKQTHSKTILQKWPNNCGKGGERDCSRNANSLTDVRC